LQEAIESSQLELAAQKKFYTNAPNEVKDAQELAEACENRKSKTKLENHLREAGEHEATLIQMREELRETLSARQPLVNTSCEVRSIIIKSVAKKLQCIYL